MTWLEGNANSLPLPAGFEAALPVLAMGAELKSRFCILSDGSASLSQPIGELGDAAAYAKYTRSVAQCLEHCKAGPKHIAVDLHPDYRSTRHGEHIAKARGLPLVGVQHHHAHVAACMAENGVALDEAPVLGIALDGLGFGDDGHLWGGEFLRLDYRRCQRLASFKPVALLGGEQAMRQPWRNTYAHLMAAMGWQRFADEYRGLELHDFLQSKPRALLDGMLSGAINSPLASSVGRLFDAVAAAAGICREQAAYEGQAAVEFEAQCDASDPSDSEVYPFAITVLAGLPCIDATPMWHALLTDLLHAVPSPRVSARFHHGLAQAIVQMVEHLPHFHTVVLSGGVFQNRVLRESLLHRLQRSGRSVLSHQRLPTHDGGLALGQAVVAAARTLPY